ncbi:hypothetical protein [Streptomyces sp. NPDC001435]|uniref:hypothetical protein n=1 Tax=unclassified Streptomyces TaxID=2593676 RepID=UPI0036C8D023
MKLAAETNGSVGRLERCGNCALGPSALRFARTIDAYTFMATDPETEVGVDPLADMPCLTEPPTLIRLADADHDGQGAVPSPNALWVITGRSRLQWADPGLQGRLAYTGPTAWPSLTTIVIPAARSEPGTGWGEDCDDHLARRLTHDGRPLSTPPVRSVITARSHSLPPSPFRSRITKFTAGLPRPCSTRSSPVFGSSARSAGLDAMLKEFSAAVLTLVERQR